MTTKQTEACGHESKQCQHNGNQGLSPSMALELLQSIESGLKNGDMSKDEIPTDLQLECSRCSTVFERSRKEIARNFRRYGPDTKFYCSQECSSPPNPERNICPTCGGKKAAHAAQCKSCHLEGSIVDLTCDQCGTEFQRTAREHKRNVDRHGEDVKTFCSRTCYDTHRYLNPVKKVSEKGDCLVCGTKLKGKQTAYCSKTCYHKRVARDVEYSGNWSSLKKKVKERDGTGCVHCGQKRRRMDVHHIDHDATNNTLENLVLLCQKCHSHYHQSSLASVQWILRDYYQSVARKKST